MKSKRGMKLLSTSKWTFLLVTTIISVITLADLVTSCNEQVCASMVSKCMLTASCKCDLKNCSCCKECYNCLSYLYSECCSCVDMCPKPNATRNALSKKSHVEDLEEIPDLFKALTDVTDEEDKWSTFTFPIDFTATFETSLYGNKKEPKYSFNSNDNKLDTGRLMRERDNIITKNCTVAFMSQCLSWNKCKTNCQSMGANSYRWFHDGCCECVGLNCMNYGINESRCSACPETKDGDEIEDFPDEDELDYGEGNNSQYESVVDTNI